MEEASKRCPGDGRADDGKNAGANDRADSQRGQRQRAQRLPQTMGRILRFADQFVDGFCGEDLS